MAGCIGPDVDCPECGVERVRPGVSMCSACEIAARYEKKIDALDTALRAATERAERAEKSAERAMDEGYEFVRDRDALRARLAACEQENREARNSIASVLEQSPTLPLQELILNLYDRYHTARGKLAAATAVVEAARIAATTHNGKGYTEGDYERAPKGSSLGCVWPLKQALAAYDRAKEGAGK